MNINKSEQREAEKREFDLFISLLCQIFQGLVESVGVRGLEFHDLVDMMVDIGFVVVDFQFIFSALKSFEFLLDSLFAALYDPGYVVDALVEAEGQVAP